MVSFWPSPVSLWVVAVGRSPARTVVLLLVSVVVALLVVFMPLTAGSEIFCAGAGGAAAAGAAGAGAAGAGVSEACCLCWLRLAAEVDKTKSARRRRMKERLLVRGAIFDGFVALCVYVCVCIDLWCVVGVDTIKKRKREI